MPGFTNAESATTLDLRFPTTGGTDYIAYSTNGSSEFANITRTAVGATGWAAATVADPSVKANSAIVTSAAVVTAGGTVTHFALFTAVSGGTQRTDWTVLGASKVVAVGDRLEWAIGALQVTLT